MAPPVKKALPTKERTLFQTLIQQYEQKQFKRGIKTADSILKKFPEHGETLAMKGLMLAHSGKSEEGLELARKGVRFDLTSFICWHALGIMYRLDKNYEEALKCYSQTLRIEKDNLNILREVAFLQIYLRDYNGYLETRKAMLRVQPHASAHWGGMALAHHVAGQLSEADKVLTNFEGADRRDIPKVSFERSEFLLYHINILEEMGEHERTLSFLEKHDKDIMDSKASQTTRARALKALGRSDEAEEAWRSLLDSNPENKEYFEGLLSVKGLDSGDASESDVLALFDDLQSKYPKSLSAKRLALDYATADQFRTRLDAYMQAALKKGIPSLFSDLKPLYENQSKRKVIDELSEGYRARWAQDQQSGEPSTLEPPSTYLWTLYFLAQHHSHLHNASLALHYITTAIDHTPTLPDLHMTKARILKRAGDVQGAADVMEDARLLDGQDRFLNSKTAKYLLRSDRGEEAVKTMGLFTKSDIPPLADLVELQCLWYLSEEADCYLRCGKYAMALKRLAQIDKTFEDIWEEQLDFHSYCLRRCTFRQYVETVRWEDKLRSHPQYVHAALTAIGIYTKLYDEPLVASGLDPSEMENMTEEDRKKAAKKAKKAEVKAKEDEGKKPAPKPDANKAAAVPEGEPVTPKDDDPEGLKLLQTKQPLEDAAKLAKKLQLYAPKRIETWLASVDVALRRKAYVEALGYLRRARDIDASHPGLHPLIVRFKVQLDSETDVQEAVRATIDKVLPSILPSEVSLDAFCSDYLQRHSSSPSHVLAAARGVLEARGEQGKAEAEDLAFQSVAEDKSPSLEDGVQAFGFLKLHLRSARANEMRVSLQKRWPLANAFKTPEELEAEARKRMEGRRERGADEDGEGPNGKATSETA